MSATLFRHLNEQGYKFSMVTTVVLALKKVRKKFTNHSARKTTVSKLKKAKIVSLEHIATVTGHRGINFLNDYDEADEEKRRFLLQ